MVVEEILRGTLAQSILMKNFLMNELSTKAEASRTANYHWVNNLILPVFLMMIFVRGEREGDWALHLWAVNEMLPYFFASGHIIYCARYGMVYLRSMEKVNGEILERFMKGEHIQHHTKGIWNGMWTDMERHLCGMDMGHAV